MRKPQHFASQRHGSMAYAGNGPVDSLSIFELFACLRVLSSICWTQTNHWTFPVQFEYEFGKQNYFQEFLSAGSKFFGNCSIGDCSLFLPWPGLVDYSAITVDNVRIITRCVSEGPQFFPRLRFGL